MEKDIEETYTKYTSTIIPLTDKYGRLKVWHNNESGATKTNEAEYLHELVLKNDYKTGLQIGTFIGYSGAYIAKAFQKTGGHLTLIDPNHPHRNVERPTDWAKKIYQELELTNTTFIDGYTNNKNSIFDQRQEFVEVDSEENVLDRLTNKERKFDFIFIDGNHSTEIALQDMQKCLKLLEKQGTIVVHDTAGTETVTIAKDLFMKEHNELSYYEVPYMVAGLGIIRWK